MDKNNCKLKILYNCIKAANTSAIGCTDHKLNDTHLLTAQTVARYTNIIYNSILVFLPWQQKKRLQERTSFGKWRFRGKGFRRMGQKD